LEEESFFGLTFFFGNGVGDGRGDLADFDEEDDDTTISRIQLLLFQKMILFQN